MQRRSFLGGLAGILAAGAAPAIVTQPMKIWVPPKPKIEEAFISGKKPYSAACLVFYPATPQELKVYESYADANNYELFAERQRLPAEIDTSRMNMLYPPPAVNFVTRQGRLILGVDPI